MSGSEQGGSVCRLAGTGQGQEVLGGGWEGARAVSAPQLGRERCQHIPGAAGQRVCVCGRRASARQLLTFPTAHPDGPTLPPGNLDPTVSPVMVMARPPAAGAPRSRAASPALPPARVLSPGSCRTPRDRVPAGTSPACRPFLGVCMASPGAPAFPKGSCPSRGAAHGQHCCSLGSSRGLGREG